MQNKFLRPILFALGFLVIFQFINGRQKNNEVKDDIVLSTKSKLVIGKEVEVEIKNNTDSPIIIKSNCPNNPLFVEEYKNGVWTGKTASINEQRCEKNELTIEGGKKEEIKYGGWNRELFGDVGRYRITLETGSEEEVKKQYSSEINITEASWIRELGRNVFYRPIFNVLVFIISIVPTHDLGIAIILLTLLIKLALLIPNHKALKAQKKMKNIQPELDALKIKYKNDPQRLTKETMAIWKKHKVNPMGSCLPMIIQFPILISLFYVVKSGVVSIDTSLLYSALSNFNPESINTVFLGLVDLTKSSKIVLPIIIGGMQFIQMKLTLGKNKKAIVKKDGSNPMAGVNSIMQYTLPIMIAFFTASLPAGVGFYWGTSTLFGIGQQLIVNKSKD